MVAANRTLRTFPETPVRQEPTLALYFIPMNHVLNDRGETVIAVGAPGSVERARCEYPHLIEDLDVLRPQELDGDRFRRSDSSTIIAQTLFDRGILPKVEPFRQPGYSSRLECSSVLEAAGFEQNASEEIYHQLGLIHEQHSRELVGRSSARSLRTPEPDRVPGKGLSP
jgi:hypothetical protein